MLLGHTPGLGAKLQERESRCVVDVNRRIEQFITCRHQSAKIFLPAHVAANSLGINSLTRGEQTLHELLLAHFEAENPNSLTTQCYVLGDIQSQGGLTH